MVVQVTAIFALCLTKTNIDIMNIFQFAANAQARFNAQAQETGYQVITTFASDLAIAEVFGPNELKKFVEDTIKVWFSNVEYFTEFVLVLNWNCWYYYEKKNEALSKLYSELYYKCNDKALDEYKGKDFEYFYRMTD